MPHAEHFSVALAAARKDQGFPSAYAFYRARGGKKVVGMTFPNYVRLEQGKGLPKGPRLLRLIELLGLPLSAPQAKGLIWAYMRDLLGADAPVEALQAAGPTDAAPGSWMMAENATRQAIGSRQAQLSLDQYKVLARDAVVYGCHVLLCNHAAGRSKKQLAQALGETPAAITRALKALVSAELAKVSKDRAVSPLAGKYVVPPEPVPAMAMIYRSLAAHRATWAKQGRSRLMHSPYLILRAPKAKVAQYLSHLSDVVRMSAIYGDVDTEDAAMFLVEGRVSEIFDAET
jgi:hypothetical protein